MVTYILTCTERALEPALTRLMAFLSYQNNLFCCTRRLLAIVRRLLIIVERLLVFVKKATIFRKKVPWLFSVQCRLQCALSAYYDACNMLIFNFQCFKCFKCAMIFSIHLAEDIRTT